jgi:hypothetical protein
MKTANSSPVFFLKSAHWVRARQGAPGAGWPCVGLSGGFPPWPLS